MFSISLSTHNTACKAASVAAQRNDLLCIIIKYRDSSLQKLPNNDVVDFLVCVRAPPFYMLIITYRPRRVSCCIMLAAATYINECIHRRRVYLLLMKVKN